MSYSLFKNVGILCLVGRMTFFRTTPVELLPYHNTVLYSALEQEGHALQTLIFDLTFLCIFPLLRVWLKCMFLLQLDVVGHIDTLLILLSPRQVHLLLDLFGAFSGGGENVSVKQTAL